MIQLGIGSRPDYAREALGRASIGAENARSAGPEPILRYNAYLEWAAEQVHLLANVVSEVEIERLIATRRYSMLMTMDPASISPLALTRLVDGELTLCTQRLDAAKRQIAADYARWDDGAAVAVVADTNVWLKYAEDPLGVNWNEVADERPGLPLVLTVPMMIVDELDRHKRNRANAPKDGTSIRRRAGLALKFLEKHAAEPGSRMMLRDRQIASNPQSSAVHLTVLEQPLDQPKLPDADLEIIDRVQAARPYAAGVKLVTADYGMVYRSRQAGLDAIRVKDYEEELTEKSGDTPS